MKRFAIFSLFLLAPLFLQSLASSEEYYGRVVGISDGDTFTLLVSGNRQVKIRLAEIDAPESGQAYGRRARQELSALAFNKQARVRVIDIDRYGRSVGRVLVDGLDVNAEMIRRGAAWVFPKYARDMRLYTLEEEARQEKRGIWSLQKNDKIPPWEWRQRGYK